MAWFENLRENPINYNNFFHPNVCHVCKWSCRDELELCANCCMISYCSEKHRMLHQEEHEKMCKAIGEINKTRNIWDSRGMTPNQWLIFRKKNVQAVQLILNRKLRLYEEQMFLFAKSCGICRQQDILTITCEKCFSVNSCADHEITDVKHDCRHLQISLWLDTYNLTNTFVRVPYSYLPNCIHRSFLVGGTGLFIDYCRSRDKLSFTWNANDYNYSDYLSKPLTVINAMNYTRFTSPINNTGRFVVHIIAGTFTDTCSMSAWEVFLHTLCNGTELLIVMVGTELEYKHLSSWDVCDMCRTCDKKLRFEYHVTLYEKYVQNLFHIQPDLIIGFDASLETLKAHVTVALLKQKCPLILTAKSLNNAKDNIKKIQEVLGIKPTHFIRNDFKSNRPYRDYEKETFFPNEYLIIYNNIFFRHNSVQAGFNYQL